MKLLLLLCLQAVFARKFYYSGDFHGDLNKVKASLRAIGFIDGGDLWTAPVGATWVQTGDLIDRGASDIGVLNFLLDLQEAHPAHIMLTLGNHELMCIKGQLQYSESLSYGGAYPGGAFLTSQCATQQDPAACRRFLTHDQGRRDFFTCNSPLRSRLNLLPAIRVEGRTMSMHAGLSKQWADMLISEGQRLGRPPLDYFNSEIQAIAAGLCIKHTDDLEASMVAISDGTWFQHHTRAGFVSSLFDQSPRGFEQQHPLTPPLWYRGYSNLGVNILPRPGGAVEIYNRLVSLPPSSAPRPLYDIRHYPIACAQFNRVGGCSTFRAFGQSYCVRISDTQCDPRPEFEAPSTIEESIIYVLDKFNADRMVLGHSIVPGITNKYSCRLFLIDIGMSEGYQHKSPQVLLLDDEHPDTATVVAPAATGTETLSAVYAAPDCSANTIRFELVDDGEVVIHEHVPEPDFRFKNALKARVRRNKHMK
jgi:hypothetical protein